MKTPVQIAVSGAAGQISYALLFRLIAGDLLGKDQPINLSLLEIPELLGALDGIAMELDDCASPLLNRISCHSCPELAFKDAELVFLIGARPRGPGMERRDLLQVNASIFSEQGRALNLVASRTVKVLVVGNPANTNALIACQNAPDLPSGNFTAMTRLDHNRARSLAAARCRSNVGDLRQVIVWGNHSAAQFPDLGHAIVGRRPVLELVGWEWYQQEFIPAVQNRGAQVILARGKSSAASAAHAALEHMRDWVLGTPADDWTSMVVLSDGSYGITPGLMFSYPVRVTLGHCSIVTGLDIDEPSRKRIAISEKELIAEREAIWHHIRAY